MTLSFSHCSTKVVSPSPPPPSRSRRAEDESAALTSHSSAVALLWRDNPRLLVNATRRQGEETTTRVRVTRDTRTPYIIRMPQDTPRARQILTPPLNLHRGMMVTMRDDAEEEDEDSRASDTRDRKLLEIIDDALAILDDDPFLWDKNDDDDQDFVY